MRKLRLRPRAQRDLVEIWLYTESHWGEAQAEKYVEGLREALRSIARDETTDRMSVEVRAYYFHRTGRHVIFYRKDDEAIEVARILHDAMDPGRHLPQ